MAAQAKKIDGYFTSFLFFLKLLFTIFRESFKYLRRTTNIVIDNKEDGKRELRVIYQ